MGYSIQLVICTCAGLVMCALAGCVSTKEKATDAKSICELAGTKLSTQEIVVKTTYVDDRFHEPRFYDAACPSVRFVPMLANPPPAEFHELTDLPFALVSGPGLATFKIEVVGHFEAGNQATIPEFYMRKLISLERVRDE